MPISYSENSIKLVPSFQYQLSLARSMNGMFKYNIQKQITKMIPQMSFMGRQHSFVIQNQASQQTKIIRGFLNEVNGVSDLREVLEQIGDPSIRNFKIYAFQQNKYIDLRNLTVEIGTYLVPTTLLNSDIILIKFSIDTCETISLRSSDNSSVKKQRSKQRTISEIIQIVRQWREIHLNPINGKKINLQEAAAMIGISKKSLDDYFYQLRLGQKYGFDFKDNMEQKVGVLRTFIKEIKPTKKSRNKVKPEKHPKKLKIIEQIGQMNRRFEPGFNPQQIIPENQAENEIDQERMEKNSIKYIEEEFYNDFDYLGGQLHDPFLNFEGSFKKRNIEEESDQLFF